MRSYFYRVFEGNVVEETTAGPTTGVEEVTTEALVVTEPVTSSLGVNVSVILPLDPMSDNFKTHETQKTCKIKISSIYLL